MSADDDDEVWEDVADGDDWDVICIDGEGDDQPGKGPMAGRSGGALEFTLHDEGA